MYYLAHLKIQEKACNNNDGLIFFRFWVAWGTWRIQAWKRWWEIWGSSEFLRAPMTFSGFLWHSLVRLCCQLSYVSIHQTFVKLMMLPKKLIYGLYFLGDFVLKQTVVFRFYCLSSYYWPLTHSSSLFSVI